MSDRDQFYILDGMYYVFRGFYAVRGMRNSKGMPTNALYAFTSMLLNVIRDHNPAYLVVAFDPPGPSFRNDLFPDYKANREAPPEDLVPQFPHFRRIVEALTIPVLEIPGYEADDVIGTAVRMAQAHGFDTTILSGDKDLYQLIDDHTVLYDSLRDKVVAMDAVLERFQVPPSGVADVLGLAGDSSDNIPGVPGIGEKTAGKLVAEFGSVEGVLANIDRISGAKRKENLHAYREQALLSKDLATIRCDVPFAFDLPAWKLTPPDFAAFSALCNEFEFRRFPALVRELFPADSRTQAFEAVTENAYRTITTAAALEEAVVAIRAAGRLSFDLETTSLDPLEAEIVGVALSWASHAGVYVPVAHTEATEQLALEVVLAALRPLLEDPEFPIIGQNIKYETKVMRRYGVAIAGFEFDTLLAAYLVDPNKRRYSLDALAQDVLQLRTIAYSDVAGSGKTQKRFDEVAIAAATDYAAEDADVTLRLRDALAPALAAVEGTALLRDVEIPLAGVLARMETTGIRIDVPFLEELAEEFAERIDALSATIHEHAGSPFTIASPKQLGIVLFETLGLPTGKRTKTGYSTAQDVLEDLRAHHPIVQAVLDYRELTKLQSTYVTALPKLVRPDTGRVHTTYQQAVAATGRLSSSDPNLQNIPIRGHEGRRIRQAFVPEPGWVLFGGDYSQIELRVLAHLSEDPVLVSAFADGEDIHRRTASEIFEVPPEAVTSEQRSAAKAINFGLIYGMGAHRLAAVLSISRDEATRYMQRYFERVPRVKPFMDELVERARTRGYAETIIGRRRPLPALLYAENRRDYAMGERLAMNTPIQGTAADLIKVAMIDIDQALRARGMKTRMLLQVHDELVFEAPPSELKAASALVKERMEQVMTLRVPLLVEIQAGARWSALK
jgi:DNA polymerase I